MTCRQTRTLAKLLHAVAVNTVAAVAACCLTHAVGQLLLKACHQQILANKTAMPPKGCSAGSRSRLANEQMLLKSCRRRVAPEDFRLQGLPPDGVLSRDCG